MPKIKKNRKRCANCGAMKYTKYMYEHLITIIPKKSAWFCKNEDKCVHRSANYKK